jgi:predicted metal-binding membrane protein
VVVRPAEVVFFAAVRLVVAGFFVAGFLAVLRAAVLVFVLAAAFFGALPFAVPLLLLARAVLEALALGFEPAGVSVPGTYCATSAKSFTK